MIVTTGDPIADGIIASLAHPRGNVTGLTALGGMLSGKRLEALKQSLPGVKTVAVLANPNAPYTAPFLKERDVIARELGLQLRVLSARTRDELDGAFTTLTRGRAEALNGAHRRHVHHERRAIVELAARHRVPAVYFDRQFVDAGGLMFYGASLVEMYARRPTWTVCSRVPGRPICPSSNQAHSIWSLT